VAGEACPTDVVLDDGTSCESTPPTFCILEECLSGVCTDVGNLFDCDDDFFCTADECDLALDMCVNEYDRDLCGQPSIDILNLFFEVLDEDPINGDGDAVHGSFDIQDASDPGEVQELQVASQEIAIEVRPNNKGKWNEVNTFTCTFDPSVPYSFDGGTGLTVDFWCTGIAPEIVSPSGVRVTAVVGITGRPRLFSFSASGTY
jgi:hypothetical protein